MDKLIGRSVEVQKLTEYHNSNRSEFIAVYGRRRVGKTFLVTAVFNNKYAFEVTGIIGGTRKEEMDSFYSALMSYGYKGTRPENWMQMFEALKALLATNTSKRKVLFIDELPCFDTPKSGFVKALDYFWNSWASKRDDILMIVCGSATSWIVKNIIDNHGGLHNRITHKLYLKPFTLKEVSEYLKSRGSKWKPLSVLQSYMILGGIPYYLSLLDVTQSLHENIDRLFFAENAELKREYDRLYKSLFSNPEKYMDIVKVLSDHKQGLTRKEIAEAVGVESNGHLTNILGDLEKCGFIRYYNFSDRVSCGIYQLVDFYSLFYHSFGKKRTTDIHYWSHLINTPKQNSWFGLAYEKVCMAHIQQILYALHLDKIHTEYYSWRSKNSERRSQIDLIIDRADNIQNICEIKYSQNEYALNKTEYQKIIDRCENFSIGTQSKKGIHVTMITTFGLTKNTYSDVAQSEVTMNDLFAF